VAARNRYERFLKKQGSRAKVTHPGKPAGSSSRLEKSLPYTEILANVSQLLMLVVVVYGYIYTVRPVFQKELVSEDLARLQLEQRKLQEQMDKQTQTLAAGEARNKELADQRSAIEAQVAMLDQKVVDAEESALDATRRAGQAIAEAKTAESALSALQTQHYGLKLQSLLGDLVLPSGVVELVNRSHSIYTLDIFEEAEANAIAQKLKSLELQPVDLAKTTLSQLKAEATKQARAPSAAVDALLARNYQEGWPNMPMSLYALHRHTPTGSQHFRRPCRPAKAIFRIASAKTGLSGRPKKVGHHRTSAAFRNPIFGRTRSATIEYLAKRAIAIS